MLRRLFTQSLPALCASIWLANHGDATTAPAKVKPRHVICFLGEWKSLDMVEKTVKAFGQGFSVDKEYSQVGADARMAKAFAASVDRVTNTFTEEDHARIKRHNTVAYCGQGWNTVFLWHASAGAARRGVAPGRPDLEAVRSMDALADKILAGQPLGKQLQTMFALRLDGPMNL